MLRSVSYSVTFPSTGRTLAQSIDFQGGFGSIVGPNEAGKSFVIEMIRFGLFGTGALRGKSEDYKSLKLTLCFTVKGQDYKVVRSISSAKLFRGEEEIAVGVRPVNSKIVTLLGFGMEVFDVASVANQGDIERLGAMKPTERKRMVDSVIGLAVLDDVAKWAGEQAALYNREADAMERTLRAPVEPVRPEDYLPVADLESDLEVAEAAEKEAIQIRGWLSAEPAKPVVPTAPADPRTVDEIQALIADQAEIQGRIKDLDRQLARIPTATLSAEQLDALVAQWDRYEAWEAKRLFMARHKQPDLTLEEIQAELANHDIIKAWNEYDRFTARIEKLRLAGSHSCPACSHSWPCEADEIARLEAERVLPPLARPEAKYAVNHLNDQLRILLDWAGVQDEWEKVKGAEPEVKPSVTRIQIQQLRDALALAESAKALQAERSELVAKVDPTDYGALLRARLAYDAQVQAYASASAAYEAWVEEKKAKLARLEEISKAATFVDKIRDQVNRAAIYERDLARWVVEQANYDGAMAEVAKLKATAEQWKRAKAALVRLRLMVKQHLVPSLNKVASHLLRGMTGGQRQKIVVDEEFNITVDDQDLDTLSGSGKAVANLALRIGLGQVLTNNVLSLFIGDEIDASMDQHRAEATSETLHALAKHIKQILLVSHKYPTADYTIELEAQK